jgi:hypothetical protein
VTMSRDHEILLKVVLWDIENHFADDGPLCLGPLCMQAKSCGHEIVKPPKSVQRLS